MSTKTIERRLARQTLEELNALRLHILATPNRRNAKWMLSLVLAAISAKTGLALVA